MTPDFWKDKRVLLTGHTGFKGAWTALWLEQVGAQVTGLSLAPEKEDDLFNTAKVETGITSHIADLRDETAVRQIANDTEPEIVIHMAAQALVLPAYTDPIGTFMSNVMGTAHLLNALRDQADLKAICVVTSDKVYSNPGTGVPLKENDRLGGYDPYSASKSCTEILVESWRRSFFADRDVSILTGRAGNVIGGGDLADHRLIPDIWRALRADKTLKLRHPKATRPWQFVLEPISGYLAHIENAIAQPQDTPVNLNFGPPPEDAWPVDQIVDTAQRILGQGGWEKEEGPTPPEAPLLTLDASLARESLGWAGKLCVAEAVEWTFEWWRKFADGEDARALCLQQINQYNQRPTPISPGETP